jgi:hypothetical protein
MRIGRLFGLVTAGVIIGQSPMRAHAAEANDDATPEEDSTANSASAEGPLEATDKDSKSSSTTSEPSTKIPDEQDHDRLHAGQFSFRMAVVGAYRIVSRYDSSPYCENQVPANGSNRKHFCGFGAPVALDFAIGFAPLSSVEPFAWARMGLKGESDTDTKPLVALGVGARLYTSNDSAFKFFIQPAVGWELEKGQGHANWSGTEYKQDLLMQLLAGPQYDFSRGFGAYAAAGITAGVFRAIQTWMEFDIGVQARFP